MSNKSEMFNIGKYLKKVVSGYSNAKSANDVYDNFAVLSKDFQEFNNTKINSNQYSSKDYDRCTPEEQELFNQDLMMVESLVCKSIYDKSGITYSWNDIWKLIHDQSYRRVEKINRKVVYSACSLSRPIGDNAYNTWNGLQIIDLDIKNAALSEKLKHLLFKDLCMFHWFLGVCKSASGKGLHVWTKISPISTDFDTRKVEYLCNFRHKYSYVYISLLKHCTELDYTNETVLQFMDMAMAKPQQGIFISSDNQALMSTGFQDLRLDVDFKPAYNTGIESVDWISHPDLKKVFSKLEWFNNEKFDPEKNIEVSAVSNISDRNLSKSIKKHYKHAQRWQLANTLTSIYGYDKALKVMTEICEGTPTKELRGDVKTASIHSKPISIWAVQELNKYHGFNIKLKGIDDIYASEQEKLEERQKSEEEVSSPTNVLNENTDTVQLYLNKDQYLSDVREDIMSNLAHITLLEAGAGYGKTEMIKALKAKTMLILPFTSTIKAKVESSETTSDWLYYYGNKRPTLDELLGEHSMSMTIDKFSRLNVMELDSANFEYIVLDESHLLFTSSYRDVMAPAIQRLANCKAKVIMMTGTPTGELLFFPNIRHIKVTKEDVRVKTFQVHFCPTDTEKMLEMCKSMVDEIMQGHKVLFPTNNGNLYFEQITGVVQKLLDQQNFGRQVNAFYYKKSNYGDETMDSINIDKTIGNNDIIFCTTYLSVGVDICDKYTFAVYFNLQWIPQDIEQFANRLRNNDLHVKMFLPKKDSSDMPINYYYTQPLNLAFDKSELLLMRDLIKTANDMIDRNQEESKYNPFIQSLLATNKYMKYDENDGHYYADETTYKLRVFEDRYSQYAKQLEIMMNGMKYYGYKTEIVDHDEEISEDRKEEIDEYMKSCRNLRYNYTTSQTFALLDHINDSNIDLYKELLRGNYEIFKDSKFAEDREKNNLYVTDIEVLERNIPIIVGLYKFYDCATIKDIYNYCLEVKQNKINYAKLQRIRKFVNIEYNRKKKRLDFPVMKFVKESQEWAKMNPIAEKEAVEYFQKEWACKYANSIPDVAVDDNPYLEKVYDLVKELWKVVIMQDRPKNKKVKLQPFELLWDRKESLDNVYGNANTKLFFMEELIDGIKESAIDEETEELGDLPMTRKTKLDEIEKELSTVIHSDFNYFNYSEEDSSNKRFMEKQENTSMLRDGLFNRDSKVESVEVEEDDNDRDNSGDLFSDEEFPF